MVDKYKVVLYADPLLLPSLYTGLSREKEIDIRFSSYRAEDVIAYIDNHGGINSDLIVLIDNQQPVARQSFLQTLKNKGVPVIAITSSVQDGFTMLAHGATDMVVRHASDTDEDAYFNRMLLVHMQDATQKKHKKRKNSANSATDKIEGKIIVIGSSTGGTETVLSLLKQMPAKAPPILVVQHMPPVFTKMYAERADSLCEIDVWEASDGDRLANGLALVAPGDYHMTLHKKNGYYQVECKKGEKVCGQCPSVDVMFDSVAQTAKSNAVGVILTGMGSDGAEGLLKMRRQGAYTIGQNEETCVVYGMPKVAYEIGAVTTQLPLAKIAQDILAHVGV